MIYEKNCIMLTETNKGAIEPVHQPGLSTSLFFSAQVLLLDMNMYNTITHVCLTYFQAFSYCL